VGPENKAKAEEYSYGREFIDLLTDFPGAVAQRGSCSMCCSGWCRGCNSIASSQRAHAGVGETSIRVVRYESHGRERQGVCSGQLGERTPIGTKLPVFLHANQELPAAGGRLDAGDYGGAGTGVAPFRAFLEGAAGDGATGDNWLFFGDQHEATDFLYREEFQAMLRDGALTRLDLAFSRDQKEKIYVQDRMQEHAAELYAWIERGAHFLRLWRCVADGQVCGPGADRCHRQRRGHSAGGPRRSASRR